MDRREALKKLALGGATVAGASLVVSSPAFASPGTPDDVATAVTGTATASRPSNNADTTVTLTAVNVACPEGGGSHVSTVWQDGSTSLTQFTTRDPNGTNTRTVTATLGVTCTDRNGLLVCATTPISITYSHTGGRFSTTVSFGNTALPTYIPCS